MLLHHDRQSVSFHKRNKKSKPKVWSNNYGTTESGLLLLLLLTTLLTRNEVESMILNIHLPLRPKTYPNRFQDECPYDQAMETNLVLQQNSWGKEDIDFFKYHTPHVTLYLTEFDVYTNNTTMTSKLTRQQHQQGDDTKVIDAAKLKKLLDTIRHTLNTTLNEHITPCRIDWEEPAVVRSAYAMYNVPNTACLQYLSDRIVNATNTYIQRPPQIPDWIFSLPLDKRREMLERIERYGSPNVYDGFVPHVTVGYDKAASNNQSIVSQRSQILHSYSVPQPCFGNVSTVAVSKSGVGGSVLQDGLLLEVSLHHETKTNPTTIAITATAE